MKGLEHFKLPRWEELPNIPLYLDQVLSLIDEWLGDYIITEKKQVITKTMVNNYVKNKFIEAPVNKKYGKLSVASLFIIAVLKTVFTIDEVSKLIDLAIRSSDDVPKMYNHFCELIENAVSEAFHGRTLEKKVNPMDPRGICWNASNAFACQLYVRSIYLHTDEVEKKNGQ